MRKKIAKKFQKKLHAGLSRNSLRIQNKTVSKENTAIQNIIGFLESIVENFENNEK